MEDIQINAKFHPLNGKKIIIETIQPDDFFGEIELIWSKKRTTTAMAVGETTIGVVDQEFIKEEFEQISKQFKNILETVPARFNKVIDRACDIAS